MAKLNETEKDALEDLMEIVTQDMSNNGCNDFYLPKTEAGKTLARLVMEKQGYHKEEMDYVLEHSRDYYIITDYSLLEFLINKLLRE